MSVADNKRAITVAVFVLVAILIFLTGIFVLGGKQSRFERTIRLTAIFDDVAGLRTGNNVWFSGVKIGVISDMSFHGESQVEVTMKIEQKAQEYIRKDSKARLGSEGFIGNKILVVTAGSADSPVVENGDLLATESSLSTEDMMATLQKNNENLLEITGNFSEISRRIKAGEGTVGALLSDENLADNFKTTIADIQRVSNNTARASADLNRFTTKLNTPGGLANDLVADTAVFSQLRSSIAQLRETVSTVSAITQNIQTASEQLNSSESTIGVLLNDKAFAKQLQGTMQNLETSTEKLDENLEALQHNFLFRRYFRNRPATP